MKEIVGAVLLRAWVGTRGKEKVVRHKILKVDDYFGNKIYNFWRNCGYFQSSFRVRTKQDGETISKTPLLSFPSPDPPPQPRKRMFTSAVPWHSPPSFFAAY